jgi:hypothetical protein
MDFATAMGVDLQTAMSLVGKTLGSSTNALARYGIQIDMSGDKEAKLSELTEQLTQKFGGAAQAAADTSIGAFKQFDNAVGDLKESFGAAIADGAEPFLRALTGLASKTSGLINQLRNYKAEMKAAEEADEAGNATTNQRLLLLDKELQALYALPKQYMAGGRVVQDVSEQVLAARQAEIDAIKLEMTQIGALARDEALTRKLQGEAAEEAEKAAAKKEEDLKNLRAAYANTDEAQKKLLESQIEYFASFTGYESLVEPVLADLRAQLEDLTKVEEEAAIQWSEANISMLDMLGQQERRAIEVAYNIGQARQAEHEAEKTRIEEEKRLRDEVSDYIIGSAFTVAKA